MPNRADGALRKGAGLSVKGGKKAFVKGTNIHGDALCFVVKTWGRHTTTETLLNNGWRLAAVGGWWRLAVGAWWVLAAVGGWRLVAVGNWQLAVGGPWGLS